MTRKPSKKTDEDSEPTVLEEPGTATESDEVDWGEAENNVWLRGLWMLLFALFFAVAEALLWLLALVQFFWMLFAKARNQPISDFGEDVADWVARITRFQTGATEDRPFPFAKWGKADAEQ
ncbi:DUF4389 domain-containing protein [Maritimibacter sp. HL-12]|jgi:hypothetical protein|uniref:DUF4389 domain-containing protein n=1 Tax=Maritimibacter sp. HL-12 TaxID=1162418 RepID=UPI000A0F3313|nr:DUF4389 domain-containing protein [Maritimibacter sp. HL-12]SMH54853.1 protein of unknown function [Maritimibacter sp. HL-12]